MSKFIIKFHNDEDFSIGYDSIRIDIFRHGQKELNNLYNSYSIYADLLFNNKTLIDDSELDQIMYIEAFEKYDLWKKSPNYVFPYSPFLFKAISLLNNLSDDFMKTKNSIIKIIKEKKDLRGKIMESKLIDLLEYIVPVTDSYLKSLLKEKFPYFDKGEREHILESIQKNLNTEQINETYFPSFQLQRKIQHQKDIEWMRNMLKNGEKR